MITNQTSTNENYFSAGKCGYQQLRREIPIYKSRMAAFQCSLTLRALVMIESSGPHQARRVFSITDLENLIRPCRRQFSARSRSFQLKSEHLDSMRPIPSRILLGCEDDVKMLLQKDAGYFEYEVPACASCKGEQILSILKVCYLSHRPPTDF